MKEFPQKHFFRRVDFREKRFFAQFVISSESSVSDLLWICLHILIGVIGVGPKKEVKKCQ